MIVLTPERNSIHTIVAVKIDQVWKFTSFQNTRAQYVGNPEKNRYTNQGTGTVDSIMRRKSMKISNGKEFTKIMHDGTEIVFQNSTNLPN